MKKIFTALMCISFALSLFGQSDQLVGKWNISELKADGETLTKEQLQQYGMDDNFFKISSDGSFSMMDNGIIRNGSWEYSATDNLLIVTIQPNEDDKAQGVGESSMKYTIDKVDDSSLTLSLGNMMTTSYMKEE